MLSLFAMLKLLPCLFNFIVIHSNYSFTLPCPLPVVCLNMMYIIALSQFSFSFNCIELSSKLSLLLFLKQLHLFINVLFHTCSLL